ncbi:hypothetical protein [Achromobacter dolens]|uniref:hypothetical protein n=1 Tax=Achromobacter dolens TaxID=1287738 RepID=UPI0031E2879B
MLDQDFMLKCADSLRELANDVQKTAIPSHQEVILAYEDFSASFPDSKLKSLVEWAGSGPVIYKFAILNGKHAASILHRFKCSKEKEKLNAKKNRTTARSYCRANLESSTLYVGSSLELRKRLREHFGYLGRTTYSMQLTHWLLPGDIKTLQLSVWKCAGLPARTVQALEDHFWDRERPLLGKRGGR